MVPPRAHLPVGVTSYVTRADMDELLAEQQALCFKQFYCAKYLLFLDIGCIFITSCKSFQ
jgi:hypothetical protein